MFGLFSRVSNAMIEAAVRGALERYEISGDLRRAIDTLSAFADQHRLGGFRRARFTEQVSAFFIEGGVTDQAAAGYGAAFALFISKRVDAHSLHWRAFEAGVEGAIRHLSGWEVEAATAAGAPVSREYVAKPHVRKVIRDSYELGWSICGDQELARQHAAQLEHESRVDRPQAKQSLRA